MIRTTHMLQYSRRREDEPLPFGPVEEPLHPSRDVNVPIMPSSCAFCRHIRLEVSMAQSEQDSPGHRQGLEQEGE